MDRVFWSDIVDILDSITDLIRPKLGKDYNVTLTLKLHEKKTTPRKEGEK
jgi:hypothetical protein